MLRCHQSSMRGTLIDDNDAGGGNLEKLSKIMIETVHKLDICIFKYFCLALNSYDIISIYGIIKRLVRRYYG